MRLTCKIYQKNDKKIFLVGELIDFMNICFVPVRILPACNNSILSLLSLLSFLSLLTVSLNQRHFPFSNFNSSSNAPYFTLKINHRNNGLRITCSGTMKRTTSPRFLFFQQHPVFILHDIIHNFFYFFF